MHYDPRNLGAQCDRCPLGLKGCLSDGWSPVPSERREASAIVAVLEAPKQEDATHQRPLCGADGGEWAKNLAAAGLRRPNIDLVHVVSCVPPGGWRKMEAGLRRERNRLTKKLVAQGATATEAKREAAEALPHPSDCCAPRLQQELVDYQYVLALGATPAQRLLGTTRSITDMEGDMLEVPASSLFADLYDWSQTTNDWTVKVVPTHDPGLVKHMPKLRPQVQATLGKTLRWFNDALTWREPEVLRQPTPTQLREWLAHAAPLWCYDYETDGINLFDLNVRCLAIATPDVDKLGRMTMPWEVPAQVARVVGINILGGDGRRRFYTPSDEADIKDILREFFLDPARLKIGHNAGYFDRQVTELWLGVVPHPVKDTLFDARFMYPDLPKGLKPTGRRMTDVHKWETNESGEKGHGSKVTDAERLTYCQYDTVVNCRIELPLRVGADANGAARPLPEWARPASWPRGLPWDLRHLDHSRQEMCVEMHKNGVYVDQAKVSLLTDRFEKVAAGLYKDLQELAPAAGVKHLSQETFKPGSYDQIRDILYNRWGLGCPYGMDPRDFYTDPGLPGTNDAVMRAHMAGPDLAPMQRLFLLKLRQYRRVRNKVLGTQLYVMTPISKGGVLHPDGRVRSSWNSHTTAPARLSSSGPNMQNQSSRKDMGGVRTIYCAAPGNVLVGCDLDQAHLRIAANYWNIQRLQECFLAEKDPHCWLAHDLFGVDFEQAPGWGDAGFSLMQSLKPDKKKKAGQMRELAKTYRYASIYWASPETKHSVIRSTELTRLTDDGLVTDLPYLSFELNQVRFFDQVWHEAEPDWQIAWQQMLQMFDQQGFMEDPVFSRRSGALNDGKKNEVVNYPILACEASTMSIAEQRVRESFPFQKWGPGTGLVAQVHDSMVVEVPERLAEWAKTEMTRCMTLAVPGWDIPFTCEAAVGRTWADV